MKTEKFSQAMNELDDKYVEKAINYQAKKRKSMWLKWSVPIAACFAVAVAAVVVIQMLNGGSSHIVDSTNRPYKDIKILSAETAFVWPWEYLAVYEKYGVIEIDGTKFYGSGRKTDESHIDTQIGTYTATARDGSSIDTENFQVYSIKNVSADRAVAVLMENKYYIFHLYDHIPLPTWGDMLDAYALPEAIEFYRFTRNGKEDAGFELKNDEYIWEVLSSCGSAQYVDPEGWNRSDRSYISLTVTSEKLGIYKKALYITEDGYLWTNMFGWAYLCDIGKEAANNILSYAEKNSQSAEFEPYHQTVVGKVVDINEEYILIDDSVLCKNAKDGIVFKILLNDIRITRYVDNKIVKMGDIIQITYEGTIDEGNGYVIDSALSASEAIIAGDDVLIPE